MANFSFREHRCIDCKCCDPNRFLCHPEDPDCEEEYELDMNDLYSVKICDFFKRKENTND